MANEEHLQLIKQGINVWTRWKNGKLPPIEADLSGADLSEANLKGKRTRKGKMK